jgi:sarcosine oxidase subunit beta
LCRIAHGGAPTGWLLRALRIAKKGTIMTGIRTTGVVVIGGGCIGLASAIALAAGGTKVTLVERALPGAANSTLTGGGIRQQFGTELNIRLSQLSAETWDHFADRYGVDPLFRPIGYLFLARTEEEAATLAAHVRLQNSLGVDSECLDAVEIARRWPALSGRGFIAAGFRAADGWANQHRIVDGFVRGAIAAGVELLAGTEALALQMSGGRIVGVTTNAGRIAADAVLVATGPWVGALLEPLGLAVPVVGRRHELLIVEPSEPLPSGLPWLIGVGDGVHVRSDSEARALVGGFLGEDRAVDPDRYDMRADDHWTRAVLETAERVFGVFGPNARVRHGWAGLYPDTPDRHPIIDQLAEGLFAALGFSGTGLMHAPAAGLLSAELIADGGMRSVDVKLLSASRFAGENLSAEPTGF